MRLGIMQPYFFPYLGHFALIANADKWIVFDISQYRPKSWMNRNRVLHPTNGWMYVTIPVVAAPHTAPTCDVRLQSRTRAEVSVRGKLSHYASRAPYFHDVISLVDATFASLGGDSLVELDLAGLSTVCSYLDLEFDYRICSELDLDLTGVRGPGGWAPAIAEAVGADAYINPDSGRDLFDPTEFARHKIELSFLEMPTFVYDTGPYGFEPNLSILDVLMWNSAADARAALASATVSPAPTDAT